MNTTPKTPLVLLADAADELHKLADRLTDAAEELLPESGFDWTTARYGRPTPRRPTMPDLAPESLAELRRLLDECKPGRVIVNDLRPTHNAIWLDSRYDSDDGWERLRTLAEIDTETETVEVLWGLDDAVLIAAAINALPDLLDAAEERDELAAAVARVRELHRQTTYVSVLVMGGPNVTDYACAHCGPTYGWPCPTRRAIDGPQSDALTFELPKPPTGHMVGGLITEGHAGQRLHADKGAES